MLTQRTAEVVQQLKPLRLNFAGYCIYCETRACVTPRCIANYESSAWGVCPECDGTRARLDNEFKICDCYGGVVEIARVFAAQQALSAVAPVSVPPVLLAAPEPRCLGCGHRTATGHPDCKIPGGSWWPCLSCAGRRTDSDGFECQNCSGVGFVDEIATDTLAERAGDVRPW